MSSNKSNNKNSNTDQNSGNHSNLFDTDDEPEFDLEHGPTKRKRPQTALAEHYTNKGKVHHSKSKSLSGDKNSCDFGKKRRRIGESPARSTGDEAADFADSEVLRPKPLVQSIGGIGFSGKSMRTERSAELRNKVLSHRQSKKLRKKEKKARRIGGVGDVGADNAGANDDAIDTDADSANNDSERKRITPAVVASSDTQSLKPGQKIDLDAEKESETKSENAARSDEESEKGAEDEKQIDDDEEEKEKEVIISLDDSPSSESDGVGSTGSSRVNRNSKSIPRRRLSNSSDTDSSPPPLPRREMPLTSSSVPKSIAPKRPASSRRSKKVMHSVPEAIKRVEEELRVMNEERIVKAKRVERMRSVAGKIKQLEREIDDLDVQIEGKIRNLRFLQGDKKK